MFEVLSWSISVEGSIFAIGIIWKHVKTNYLGLKREDESNEDWEKKKDTVYIEKINTTVLNQHTCTVWMVCTHNLFLWRYSWSTENATW